MAGFDPNQTRLVDCELVHRLYETHPMLRDNQALDTVMYDLKQCIIPLPEKSCFYAWLRVQSIAYSSSGGCMAKDLCYFRALFQVDNFEEVVTIDDAERKNTLDTNAAIAFLSITLSTARGQLQALQVKTVFAASILPMYAVSQIGSIPRFALEELVPSWYDSPDAEFQANLAPEITEQPSL